MLDLLLISNTDLREDLNLDEPFSDSDLIWLNCNKIGLRSQLEKSLSLQ